MPRASSLCSHSVPPHKSLSLNNCPRRRTRPPRNRPRKIPASRRVFSSPAPGTDRPQRSGQTAHAAIQSCPRAVTEEKLYQDWHERYLANTQLAGQILPRPRHGLRSRRRPVYRTPYFYNAAPPIVLLPVCPHLPTRHLRHILFRLVTRSRFLARLSLPKSETPILIAPGLNRTRALRFQHMIIAAGNRAARCPIAIRIQADASQ